jgi:hypothetical protein
MANNDRPQNQLGSLLTKENCTGDAHGGRRSAGWIAQPGPLTEDA